MLGRFARIAGKNNIAEILYYQRYEIILWIIITRGIYDRERGIL